MSTHRSPRVAIVGAGMSGLGMAMRLARAGYLDFTIFEKADDLGGTWHHNSYPGLACDVPARFYTYAHEPNPDWSQFFPGGAEIWRYFDTVARRYGLREHIRFGQQVTEALWTGAAWAVTTNRGDQGQFDFLITATGILHTPKFPDIDGLETFAGPAVHSARWDHDVDLTGKRVGIIGNGSTGVQIISALAGRASQLSVFLRTPQWILPVPNWPYSAFGRLVIGRSPRLGRLAHRLYQRLFEMTFGEATAHQGWQRSLMSGLCRLHLRRVSDPDLRRRLTPNYKPMCKRIVMGLGFYKAVQRPDVELITDRIRRVVPEGIETVDGVTHPLDVLVLATGFDSQAFMRPMALTGENGVTLDELWSKAPFAYRSVALPGFPNYFMLVGPHSPFGNFSVIAIAEAQADYIMRCIGLYTRGEVDAMAPCVKATDEYNAQLVRAMPNTIWTSGCSSWYLDSNGRPNTFPGTPARHRALLAEPVRAHFHLAPAAAPPIGAHTPADATDSAERR
jgi:cation diffusion facilitator CzcD-associated flavoprotein CzcO